MGSSKFNFESRNKKEDRYLPFLLDELKVFPHAN